MNNGWVYCDRIRPQHSGLTLLQFYTRYYRHSTARDWQARIDAGQISVDGKPAAADDPLQPGQRLEYHRPPWPEPNVPLNLDVIYDDGDLLVVAKPAGLPVLPGGGFLEHTLVGQLQLRYPEAPPFPIHRLGRGTSGLVLLARTQAVRAQLSAAMRDRKIHKEYRALVGPWDLPAQLTIQHPIGQCPHPTLGYVYGVTPTGKAARSDCQVLERRTKGTVLAVTIQTGRPHQIRIHLAAMGHPLLGDPLYGADGILLAAPDQPVIVPGDGGYHLHAAILGFTHPCTGEPMTVIAPSPPQLRLAHEQP